MIAYVRKDAILAPARIDAFKARYVQKGPDECWVWTGDTSHRYGVTYLGDSSEDGRRHRCGSHRVAWVLINGPIPDGMVVCHRCDNPPCVNPSHLFLGTQADNMRDCKAKGRTNAPRGVDHPRAKLTEADVVEMRSLRASGSTLASLAARFGVPVSAVSNTCTGKTWKHLPGFPGLSGPAAGEKVGTAKLTDDKVIEMRRLHSLGSTYVELGGMFGVDKMQAWRACTGRSWKHLPELFAGREAQ